MLALGNLFWVPLSRKIGKRVTMVISMAIGFAAVVWTARAKSYGSLLGARCLSGFASSTGEVMNNY
jgi:MFS family permease